MSHEWYLFVTIILLQVNVIEILLFPCAVSGCDGLFIVGWGG